MAKKQKTSLRSKPKKLSKKQSDQKAIKEAKEYLEGWKRSRAEFENYKKDEQKRLEEFSLFLEASVIEKFLPVLDSFDEALKHVPEANRDDEWLKGIIKIREQILNTLEKLEVKEIDALGKEFDPEFHEAVGEVVTKEEKKDKVIQVLQKGYLIKDKVLRPVRVYVGK